MLVLGANLALDRTLRIDRLRPGHVQRPRSAQATAGGKSVNVCRAAVAHGVRPLLVANLPGVLGAYVGDLLDGEGHSVRRVPTAGEIRSATIVLDDDARATVLNEPGPDLADQDRAALIAAVAAELPGHCVTVLSGSLPPGTPQDLYGEVVDLARASGSLCVVDAAREALLLTLAHHPDVVTPNLSEAHATLAGGGFGQAEAEGNEDAPLDDVRAEALGAARGLVAAGARTALVTAGRHGVAGWDTAGGFWVDAPRVDLVNSIGAGDSFVAGLACALEAGHDVREGCVVAVATASASVTTPSRAMSTQR